jgi:hypothetical protein
MNNHQNTFQNGRRNLYYNFDVSLYYVHISIIINFLNVVLENLKNNSRDDVLFIRGPFTAIHHHQQFFFSRVVKRRIGARETPKGGILNGKRRLYLFKDLFGYYIL